MKAILHAVARCRWCQGSPFELVFGSQWICTNPTCAAKQIEHAELKKDPPDGASPYLFLPLPIQVDTKTSPHKRLLVAGSAGSSKSYGGRWLAYQQCLDVPGSQVLLLRVSYRQLTENHLKFMFAEAKTFQLNGVDATYYAGNVMKMIFKNHGTVPNSEISMGYCDSLADIGASMGAEYDLIIFEEASAFLGEALATISTRDRGSHTAQRLPGVKRDGRTIYLSNPGGRGALYLADACITKKPDPREYPHYNPDLHGFIHAKVEDNPYLAPDYVETTLSGLSAARYQQLRYGDWSVVVGQFFDLDPSVHVQALEVA